MIRRAQVAALRGQIQAQAEDVCPATLRFLPSAQELAGSTGGLKKGDKLDIGGFMAEHDIRFHVRKALLVSASIDPNIGDKVVWVERGLTFRIEETKDGGETAVALAIACKAANK